MSNMLSHAFNLKVSEKRMYKFQGFDIPEFEVRYIGNPRGEKNLLIGMVLLRNEIEQNNRIKDQSEWELVEIRCSRVADLVTTTEVWQQKYWRSAAIGRFL